MSKSAAARAATGCATSAPRANKMSRADFAKVMGVDRAQPSRWADRGMPTFPDGDVDPVICANWVRQNVENHKLRGSIGAGQLQAAERARWIERLAFIQCCTASLGEEFLAPRLLPSLGRERLRAIFDEWRAKERQEVTQYMSEEFPPPTGCRSWGEWLKREEHLQEITDEVWTYLCEVTNA